MSDTNKPNKSGKIFDKKLFSRLFAYTKPYRNYFILGIFLTIIISLVSPVRPMIYQYIIDNEVTKSSVSGVRMFILATLGMLVLETLLGYTNTLLTNWLGQSVIKDIRNQIFQHLLRLRLSYYDNTPIGQLQTRTVSDVETLNDIFRSGVVKISGDMLQLVAIAGVMFYQNWKLTLVIMATVPLMIITTRIFQKNVKVAFQNVRKEVSAMNTFLQEHISGMNIVQIFNRENVEYKRFNDINLNLRKANVASVLYYSIFFPVIEIISALALALLVWYGVGQIIAGKDMTFGTIVAFVMYVQMFFRPIRMLADEFNTLQLGMVSAERIFKVLDTDEFIDDTGKNPNIPTKENLSIELKDVWFAYKEEEWVLKGINLTANAGEKIAFVGSTGSGKSTIINLIGRFYEIQKGEILINGINAKEFPLDDLRSTMGVVLQDVFLFSGSIYDNITLNNPEIPLEVVKEAARQVGAADFIEALPGGYDYQVRERGATLSLGQRQLIAFARVWVYDPAILILDEATANIDTESEEIIQLAIDRVMSGRTCILVAHRLSTIQKADKIVVLSKGEILEMGNHQALLANKGTYFDMFQLQFA